MTETTPAGNTSLPSDHTGITVNTSTPATPPAPVFADDNNVSIPSGSTTSDAHPHISGTGTAGDTVKIYDGANVIGSAPVGLDGKWTFLPTTDLINGTHSITVVDTNSAGTSSAHSAPATITVNTVVLVPVITSVVDAVGPVQGNVPSGGVSDDNQPTVHGTGKAGDIIQLYAGANSDWNVGSVQVGPDGTWFIRVNSPMGLATHELSATETNSAGVTGAHSAYWAITIVSSTISTPAAPTITDNGNVIPSGSTMPDGHPTISGSGTAKDIIKVYDGSTLIGSTTVDQNGHWSFTPTTDLSKDSVHPISVIESNAAGAASAQSPATSVTVSSGAPVITSVVDAVGLVTGAIPNGGATDDLQPTVYGTGIPGYSVLVYTNGLGYNNATVNEFGQWSVKLRGALSLGSATITATQYLGSGPNSDVSNSWSFTVYSATVSTPAAPTITDNGNVIPSGGSMPDGHPTISGSGTAKDIIKVYDGANVIGSTTVDSNGHWSFTPSTDLSKGSAHPISVIESNSAGATSAQSPATSVTVGTSPATPATPTLTDDSGASIANGSTSVDGHPHINGTGTATDIIKVYDGSTLIGSTTVNSSGKWTFTPSADLSAGAHSFSVTETNSGGTSANSGSVIYAYANTYNGPIMITNVVDPAIGTVPSGGSTSDPQPFVYGVGIPGQWAWVGVYDAKGINKFGTCALAIDDTGHWSLQTRLPLAAGTYYLQAFQAPYLGFNSYGTASPLSAPWIVTITSGVSQTLSATHDDTTSATLVAAVADASTSTTQADHHTVVGEHDTFVGHVVNGNETVDLNVDPTVYFKQATAHIEGAKGVAVDTLHLTGDHQVLDLTSLTGQTAAAKISGIEVIDLGGHTNTLKLSLTDVLNLGETDLFQTDGKQQMMIKGSDGDSVDLSNSHIAGLAEGEWQAHGTTQVGGVTYNVYEHSGVHTELLVQQGVQIVVH